MNKRNCSFSTITITLIIILLLFPMTFLNSYKVIAANLTSISDTMTRIEDATASSHDILFTLGASTALDSGETVTIDFDEDGSGYTVDGASTAIGDLDFNDGTERTIVGIDGDCTGHSEVNDIVASVNDSTGVLTFEACGTYTSSASNATINVEYGTVAGGTNRVTNPSAGTVTTDITAAGDTGTFAVDIIADDQVTITATIDSTLDVTLSSTTCALGTLSASTVETCTYNVTVSTNAASGYAGTILEDGDLRDGSNEVDDETGGSSISAGTEEYGLGVDSSGQAFAQENTCTDGGAGPVSADAITGTAQQFASSASPVSSDATAMCHAAAISGTTEAGSYEHLVTIIVTATF